MPTSPRVPRSRDAAGIRNGYGGRRKAHHSVDCCTISWPPMTVSRCVISTQTCTAGPETKRVLTLVNPGVELTHQHLICGKSHLEKVIAQCGGQVGFLQEKVFGRLYPPT